MKTAQKFIAEFKKFAIKGNVIDLAVGIIIGAAFQKIVTSLVSDLIMPPIGFILGGVNFSDLKIKIGDASINYGNFIETVIDFIIIAWVVFIIVKIVNRMQNKKEEEKKLSTPEDIKLLREIRDLLQKKESI